jgi:hypothetical protein
MTLEPQPKQRQLLLLHPQSKFLMALSRTLGRRCSKELSQSVQVPHLHTQRQPMPSSIPSSMQHSCSKNSGSNANDPLEDHNDFVASTLLYDRQQVSCPFHTLSPSQPQPQKQQQQQTTSITFFPLQCIRLCSMRTASVTRSRILTMLVLRRRMVHNVF